MSFIITRKVKNTTYVYEVTSYRNKEGKPRNRQKCLGKLDNDGILISSKKRHPLQIEEVKIVTRKIILKPARHGKLIPFVVFMEKLKKSAAQRRTGKTFRHLRVIRQGDSRELVGSPYVTEHDLSRCPSICCGSLLA